ncbi:MAG: MBL fold metallo-hydrolase [Chitinispirillales bacterium]|jgi:phosphoribosyl 1,2-cyclic phosphate phosphodiesterase|nr:MBL fold metallo-hydrolase [Chitinispirillales bacterium]
MFEILFLGTGTSHGVPTVDCMINDYKYCSKNVCRLAQNDKKHKRSRSSILVSFNEKNVLIDCGPDFREQVLREKIKKIDAVLFTHRHSDHICGVPDIRSYSGATGGKFLPVYGSPETIGAISQSFSYIFDPNTFVGGGIPELERNVIIKKVNLFEMEFVVIPVEHGSCKGCFGYRFGDIAYIPDVKSIPKDSINLLKNLELLIIDCLRMKNVHSTHFIYDDVKNLIERINPKKVLGTHLCHDIHYKTDEKVVDKRMKFAYDGLKITV